MGTGAGALDALYEEKAAAYAAFGNGTVARMALDRLPLGGRVLDVGCASGGLLALLRDRAGHTAGIELSASAAAAASEVADQVVQMPIEDPGIPFEASSFDLVVLADVLEHLVDPEAALARAVEWARPGGAVIVSVPNVAHWRARLTVAAGRWPQEETGTFDASHLRFFTLERLRELMRGGGLEQVAVEPVVPALRNHVPPIARMPHRLTAPLEARWQALGRRLPNLLGYQLVACGRRAGS